MIVIHCNCGIDSKVASVEVFACTHTSSFSEHRSPLFEVVERLIYLIPCEANRFLRKNTGLKTKYLKISGIGICVIHKLPDMILGHTYWEPMITIFSFSSGGSKYV